MAQSIFTQNVVLLIKHVFDSGYTCTMGEVYRTPEQAELYYKEGKGIKNSLHCKKLAIDLNLFLKDGSYANKSSDYSLFGEYWEKLHPLNRWGGRFNDGNHFEMRDL